jgi:hypothetical protein
MHRFTVDLYLLISVLFLTGCAYRSAYYVSPFNGNNSIYHNLPHKTDSARSAFYASANFTKSSANDLAADKLKTIHSSIYRSNHFGDFQAYYGASFSFGWYDLARFDSIRTPPGQNFNDHYQTLNKLAGKHTFGGLGFQGGINYVISGNNIEWRIFGIETSMIGEYGNYLNLRKNLADTSAEFVIRNHWFETFGWYSEVVFMGRKNDWGFGISNGIVLGSEYRHNPDLISGSDYFPKKYSYTRFNIHLSQPRWTEYIMFGGATKAAFFQTGATFKLSRK